MADNSSNKGETGLDRMMKRDPEVIDLCCFSSDEENCSNVVVVTGKRKGPPQKENDRTNSSCNAKTTTATGAPFRNHKQIKMSQRQQGSPPTAGAAAAAAATTTKTTIQEKLSPPRLVLPQNDRAVVTYGILPLLHQIQPNFCSQSRSLQHIQQVEKWSCGFRNLQMLLSALVPLLPPSHRYFPALQHIYFNEQTLKLAVMAKTDQSGQQQQEETSSSILILPSLSQLQEQLEMSWKAGFDPRGAHHFKHSIVGRPSQIGAVEVGFLLGFWFLDSCVVQFLKCAASRRCLPAFVYYYFSGYYNNNNKNNNNSIRSGGNKKLGTNHTNSNNQKTTTTATNATPVPAKALACVKWAEKYSWQSPQKAFRDLNEMEETTAASRKEEKDSLPLYLQWEGHSVTVIGMEVNPLATNWNQMNLLILDPLRKGANMTNGLKASPHRSTATIRLPIHCVTSKDCQLVLTGPTELTKWERQDRKQNMALVSAMKEAVMQCV